MKWGFLGVQDVSKVKQWSRTGFRGPTELLILSLILWWEKVL